MEHLLIYLVHGLLALDDRWLRPLAEVVPEAQTLLLAPADVLAQRDIEIGPWKCPIRGFVVPLLLAFPCLIATVILQSSLASVLISAVWLVVAGFLRWANRGGRCILRAGGVDFAHRGVTVHCPWEVLAAPGHSIYHPGDHRLQLPANSIAMALLQLHDKDGSVQKGPQIRASHFRTTAEAIILKHVYEVVPQQLGELLLGVAHGMVDHETASVLSSTERLAPSPDGAGWIVMHLTRLLFPPVCCGCGGPADDQQEFRAYRTFFSSDWTSSIGESFVIIMAPVCRKCQVGNRRRYWRTLLLTIVLLPVGITGAAFVVGLVLELLGIGPGPGAMLVITTCSGLIVGIAFASVVAHRRATTAAAPLAVSDYRPGDGTVRLRFRNPRAAEAILDHWA